MNRREFLRAAAVLTAGASALPPGWTMNDQQKAFQKAFLAARPGYIDRKRPDFFSGRQRAACAAMAEQVIPATDTPGARDAGVPRFIELMVGDWFNEAERDTFTAGMADVQRRAGGDFAALPQARQLALLEEMEAEAGDSDWYEIGAAALRVWDDSAPFICQFKELCVLGFFLSEVGATQVLRSNPMGEFKGDIPLEPGESAYSTTMPMRVTFEGTS